MESLARKLARPRQRGIVAAVRTLCLSLVVWLCACGGEDRLTVQLRELSALKSWGGVRSADGDSVTVAVRGESAKEAFAREVTRVFEGFVPPEIVVRPEMSTANESTKDAVSSAAWVDAVTAVDYDETTGYARIGIRDARKLRAVEDSLGNASIDMSLVIIDVTFEAMLGIHNPPAGPNR